MSDLKQAAQQALEALIDAANVLSAPMFAEAVDALKAALEQPEQEPVAWIQPGLRDWLCVSYEKDDVHTVPVYPHPPQQQAEPPTCAWSSEDDAFMPGTYRSACGELWSYLDGGWIDNRVNFCHGCGGKVVEAANNIQEPKS